MLELIVTKLPTRQSGTSQDDEINHKGLSAIVVCNHVDRGKQTGQAVA